MTILTREEKCDVLATLASATTLTRPLVDKEFAETWSAVVEKWFRPLKKDEFSFGSFSIVNQLDSLGNENYVCKHNAMWDKLVFQCIVELRGPFYDLYVIRVNPDGTDASGKFISTAADFGVAVSAKTSADATVKAFAHGKARAERRKKGEAIPGKCFILHHFYAADSTQLANEKRLCAPVSDGGRGDRFELLQL